MKTTCLFDTNVVSETSKPNSHPNVLKFIESQGAAVISALTLHELAFGVMRLPQGKKRTALGEWLYALKEQFASRIVAIDDDIAEIAGQMRAGAYNKGWDLDLGDSFVAATAGRLAIPLVTRNEKHFRRLDLTIINPWTL